MRQAEIGVGDMVEVRGAERRGGNRREMGEVCNSGRRGGEVGGVWGNLSSPITQ